MPFIIEYADERGVKGLKPWCKLLLKVLMAALVTSVLVATYPEEASALSNWIWSQLSRAYIAVSTMCASLMSQLGLLWQKHLTPRPLAENVLVAFVVAVTVMGMEILILNRLIRRSQDRKHRHIWKRTMKRLGEEFTSQAAGNTANVINPSESGQFDGFLAENDKIHSLLNKYMRCINDDIAEAFAEFVEFNEMMPDLFRQAARPDNLGSMGLGFGDEIRGFGVRRIELVAAIRRACGNEELRPRYVGEWSGDIRHQINSMIDGYRKKIIERAA